MRNRLFSTDSPKAIKADSFGYLNAIHYMAPHTRGGVGNLCVNASPACILLCLGHTSGQAGMVADIENGDNSVRRSRREKARRFMTDNVAVVFANRPPQWRGFPVVDGDKHDLRHLDPRGGFVIGLTPKGRVAKKDASGFVVR